MAYNLLINGVYYGYNPLILTIYYLPGTSKWVGGGKVVSFCQSPTRSPAGGPCESPLVFVSFAGISWCFVFFFEGGGESKGGLERKQVFGWKGRMGN